MKKIYLKPEIESTEIYAAFVICGNSANTEGGGDNTDPFPAPKRRTPTF